jgi:hypothetical protein
MIHITSLAAKVPVIMHEEIFRECSLIDVSKERNIKQFHNKIIILNIVRYFS